MAYADHFKYNRKVGILASSGAVFSGGVLTDGQITETKQIAVSQWKKSQRQQYADNKIFDNVEMVFIVNPKTITLAELRALKQVRVYDTDGTQLFDGDVISPHDIGDSGRLYMFGVNRSVQS